ncbi:AraC family transcriptional regulator [Paenibacillus ginsengihumi]|uniref:AraC family transcriptional regulator n=1 Tax=Paenibacillus ginsengihumi TaxID=431596 RepID=UPI00036DCF11|nr:AraC family transcriptional regulator [Paenibacillus ginsengihumi]
MDLNLLSPYIRSAADLRAPADWHLKERALFDYELLYIMDGELLIIIEGVPYEGKPGDLFLLKPRQRHTIRSVGSQPVRQSQVHFDPYYRPDSPAMTVSFKLIEEMSEAELEWVREDAHDPLFALPNYLPLSNPLPFETMLLRIVQEMQEEAPYAEMKAKGLFIQLWSDLLREYREKLHRSEVAGRQQELDTVRSYLENHYGEDVTLETLARLASLSKYYLISLFKKAFGMTPMKYQQLYRIQKAKDMIRFSSDPLKQIAARCGYRDIHSFSRTFRKVEGVPPSFYRAKGS